MRHTSMSRGHTSMSGPPHKQGGAIHTVHSHNGTTQGGQSLIGGVSNPSQAPVQGAAPGAGPTPAPGGGVPPVLPPELTPH
jgi:hypothetical protein